MRLRLRTSFKDLGSEVIARQQRDTRAGTQRREQTETLVCTAYPPSTVNRPARSPGEHRWAGRRYATPVSFGCPDRRETRGPRFLRALPLSQSRAQVSRGCLTADAAGRQASQAAHVFRHSWDTHNGTKGRSLCLSTKHGQEGELPRGRGREIAGLLLQGNR